MQGHPLIEMRSIVKTYPGVRALDGVDLEVMPGEVMALVGENGAGKSTLLKILAGAQAADSGTIEMDGAPVEIHSPRASQALGLAVIYQELLLAEHLTVAENIYAGREPKTRWGTVDFKTMTRGANKLLNELGIEAEARDEVGRLTVANRQMVEIAKALSMDARVVVMDEPTSSLTLPEVETLMELIRELRGRGVSVVYVSHRMPEIFAVADRITVLRDGALVGVREAAETTPNDIVTMMVGRELTDLYGTRAATENPRPPVLEVRGLTRGTEVREVSFSVRPGEILGLAGLIGAGRSETARLIFGMDARESGEILIEGDPSPVTSPRDAIAAGIAFVPEDRKLQGLFLQLPVRVNISSASLSDVSTGALMSRRRERELASEYIAALNIRTPSPEVAIGSLSGGNQQKAILARWLARHPRILLLDEPTRGVDVGAKAEIYTLIRKLAADDVAIVVISSDLPEVIGISDRIVVMREGEVTGELVGATATEEQVMVLATGVTESAA